MKDKFDALVDHFLQKGFFLEEAVELLEKELIGKALLSTAGNQSAASKLLGIHRNTLQRKMLQYQLRGRRVQRKPPGRAGGAKARAARKTS